MEYKALEKVYYSDHTTEKSTYEQVYQAYLNSPATVVLSQKIGEFPIFFVQTTELVNKLYQISSLEKGLYRTLDRLPKIALQQYTRLLLINEVHITNEIEGVVSTRKEISEILESNKRTNKNARLFNLVKKYAKLVSNEQIPLDTCEDVRALYDEIVLPEIVATDKNNAPDGMIFRKEAVYVKDEKQEIIHSGLLPESKIIEAMNGVLQIIKNEKINILCRIAIAHYLIGYIHPFYDGNGRLNRFISSYLISQELNAIIGYGISYTIKSNKNKYAKLFSNTNKLQNRGDLTHFILGFFDIIIEAIENINSNLQKKKEKYFYYINLLGNMKDIRRREVCCLLMQNALFDEDGFTKSEIVEFVNSKNISMSIQTLRKIFVEYNEIIVSSRQSKKRYTLDLDKFDEYSKNLG